MSASTTITRSRPARYGAVPVGLLLAAALIAPAGAHAAESTPAAKDSHALVAQAAKKRCSNGKRAVRRHGRWVCKRARVIHDVSVPAPPPPPQPSQPAPQQPSQPTPPSIVDVTRGQAETWARSILATGRAVDFRIDGCQPVTSSHGFCHVDFILPGAVALYDRYLFNTFVGSVQTNSTYLYEGRFYL